MKEAGAIDKRERENQFEPFLENPPFLWGAGSTSVWEN